MSFWRRLLHALGFHGPESRNYHLDEKRVEFLQTLAEEQGLSEEQITTNLILRAIAHRWVTQDLLQRWESLSPREKQVAIMICRNYTTGEMATRMVVSPNTVKAHLRKIMVKLDVHSRHELRLLLADFNFDLHGGDEDLPT